MPERALGERGRIGMPAADQGHVKAGEGQRGTDPDHTLIEHQIICYREKELLPPGHEQFCSSMAPK